MASALDSGSSRPGSNPSRWTLTFVSVEQDTSLLQRLSPAFYINVYQRIYCCGGRGGGEGGRKP